MYKLYGDGIHDDTLAIQELIDNAGCELNLPTPKKNYLISKPLVLPSNFKLTLPRFAEIKLADNSNCYMLRNKMVENPEFIGKNTDGIVDRLINYTKLYLPDYTCENIELCGGIWNFNNMGQAPNPLQSPSESNSDYTGMAILFYNVRNLKVHDLTMKDPSNFAISLDTVSYFTVENIDFDFNYGNPLCINMDGIHLYGNCHFGYIKNLKGACRDDLVALNADEGTAGPITNIVVDGLFAEDCHSAVRLLCVHQRVENIHISNVYGTYYQYCIGITKYYKGESEGYYDAITIDNVYASKSPRYDYIYPWPEVRVFDIIFIESGLSIKNLSIKNLHRREYNVAIPTIRVGENTVVDNFILEDVSFENHLGEPMPLLLNEGTIKNFVQSNLRTDGDTIIDNKGTIENM